MELRLREVMTRSALNSMLPLHAGVIEQAIFDLKSLSRKTKRSAAAFLLAEPAAEDCNDVMTLAGICLQYDADAEFIAKTAWDSLTPQEQKRVKEVMSSFDDDDLDS